MAERALIIAGTGQAGCSLAELVLSKGYEVWGVMRRSSSENYERIEHLRDRRNLCQADLLDQPSPTQALLKSEPGEVYNPTAPSFVPTSWTPPVLTAEFTAVGVTRRLEAIRQINSRVRFSQASSSEMFGTVLEVPQSEVTPFSPRSPYGVAKVCGHFITVNDCESYGVHCSSGCPFNHESSRRGLEFVARKVTDAVARITLGLATELPMGNLDAQRDWGFAGDDVEAMWMMLQQDEADDYVVATGEAHTVERLVEVAFSHVGLDWHDYVTLDQRFVRPAEVDLLIGDRARAEANLGWTPTGHFEQLVQMMVDADVARLDIVGR